MESRHGLRLRPPHGPPPPTTVSEGRVGTVGGGGTVRGSRASTPSSPTLGRKEGEKGKEGRQEGKERERVRTGTGEKIWTHLSSPRWTGTPLTHHRPRRRPSSRDEGPSDAPLGRGDRVVSSAKVGYPVRSATYGGNRTGRGGERGL